ncbi:MAG TPA: hypothetical protein VGJ57_01585 [Nitrospirales bacterium]|jgi:hypothetical protein
MRHTWISITGLGVCSLLGVLFLSDVSWALPKKTTTFCSCSCKGEDVLGKPVETKPDTVQFSTTDGQCLFKKCKVGLMEGTTRWCSFEERPQQLAVPPGELPQLQPTTPGMGRPTPGIMRRDIEEGTQSPEPTPGAPTSPEQPSGGK